MKTKMGTAGLLLVLLMCISLTAGTASAQGIAQAEIPVTVQVLSEQENPIPDSKALQDQDRLWTIRLTAEDDAPLPANPVLRIRGNAASAFRIEYDRLGIYHYRVTQELSSLTAENNTGSDRWNYDTGIYYVTVSVIRAEDGATGTVVSAHRGSTAGDKTDLVFTNTLNTENESETNLPQTESETESQTNPSTQGENDPPKNSSGGKAPKTGDETPLTEYTVLLFGTGAVLVLLIRGRRKRNRTKWHI